MLTRSTLSTSPLPCVVHGGVFDAFGWAPSSTLELRLPIEGASLDRALTGDNPPGMAFVFTAPCDFLPSEDASVHLPRLCHPGERILAPYAIDDATDELYAHGVEPRSVLCLATDSVAGVFWGLHDWAHFHNHGPFVERAYTELQCDVSALRWLFENRRTLGVSRPYFDALYTQWTSVARARFAAESLACPDLDRAFAAVGGDAP